MTANGPILPTEQQLAQERERVLSKLTELREVLRATVDPDMEDGAPEMEEQGRAGALLRELEGQLESLDRALEMVRQGTYGICERCGQPIDPARLEAVPETTLCLPCKQLSERSAQSRPRQG